jgi:hypothetical protein
LPLPILIQLNNAGFASFPTARSVTLRRVIAAADQTPG